MVMEERINILIAQEWCGQMVENSHHQNGPVELAQLLNYSHEIRIVDAAMLWYETPQGNSYWSRIQYELGSI